MFTREFIILNLVMFLAYANVAVFFQYHSYLASAGYSEESIGMLIGLFSFTALVVRPAVTPFVHTYNARVWIAWAAVASAAALTAYALTVGFYSTALVRIFHGAAFTVLGAGIISALTACIPKNQSAGAFGFISIIVLIPCAVIPPLLNPLTLWLGGFDRVLALFAVTMPAIIPLVFFIKPAASSVERPTPPTWSEIRENLADRTVLGLLLIGLAVWTTFTAVFFFIKAYAQGIGIANPGWFLTISTTAEIGVRLIAGKSLDKYNKSRLLLLSLGWTAASFALLPYAINVFSFYLVGLLLGIGWGVLFPILNGHLFDVSAPKFRGFNANLGAQMYQTGFFVGPMAGGVILENFGGGTLFLLCGVILAATMIAWAIFTRPAVSSNL